MEYKNNTIDVSPSVEAYTAYEMSYFANARAMGDLVHGIFDDETIRDAFHQLEESTFEAVEAGCINELEALQQLYSELWGNHSALQYHRRAELVGEVAERMAVVESRIIALIAVQYPNEVSLDNYGPVSL